MRSRESETRLERLKLPRMVAWSFVAWGLWGCCQSASAQSKPFWITFRNNTDAVVRLEVTRPAYENLGQLRPGQSMEADFNRNEQIRIVDARTRRVLKTHTIRGTTVVEVGRDMSSPNPPVVPTIPGTVNKVVPNTPGRFGNGNLQAETLSALRTVNAARARLGKKPFQTHPLLQQAAERRARFMAERTRVMNDIMQTSEHTFTDPATGQPTGMNLWVRQTGYRLPSNMRDFDNNVESTYAVGGEGITIAGSGIQVINAFLGEGPGGGHYQAMMQDHDHFAFAASVGANGTALLVCVLVASEETQGGSGRPLGPTEIPIPVDPVSDEPQTGTGPGVVAGGPDNPAGNTVPTPAGRPTVSYVVDNQSGKLAEIQYVRNGLPSFVRIPPKGARTVTADERTQVRWSAGQMLGSTYATSRNPTLVITDQPKPTDPTDESTPVTSETAPTGRKVVLKQTLDQRGYYNNDNLRYYNFFQRNWIAGRSYKVTVKSNAFPPVVLIRKGANGNHTIDTNESGRSTATIRFTPSESKMYSINVTSAQQAQQGEYTITIEGE